MSKQTKNSRSTKGKGRDSGRSNNRNSDDRSDRAARDASSEQYGEIPPSSVGLRSRYSGSSANLGFDGAYSNQSASETLWGPEFDSMTAGGTSNYTTCAEKAESEIHYPRRHDDFQLGPGIAVNPGLADPGQWRSRRERNANNFDGNERRDFAQSNPTSRREAELHQMSEAAFRTQSLDNVDTDPRQDKFWPGTMDVAGAGSQFSDQMYPFPGNVNGFADGSAVWPQSYYCDHGYQQWHCPFPGCHFSPGR